MARYCRADRANFPARFIPPANAFRYLSPSYMTASLEEQRRAARIAAWADGYPAHQGLPALDVCQVSCPRCGVLTLWALCRQAQVCPACNRPLWRPETWAAAVAILRVTRDFDLFNEALLDGVRREG